MKIKQILKNQDGNTIVESSVVMPLVIMSFICVCLIIIFLVNEAFAVADLHTGLRKAEGNKSETRISQSILKQVHYTENYNLGKKVMNSTKNVNVQGNFLLPNRLKKQVTAKVYEMDEKKIVMYKDFIENL